MWQKIIKFEEIYMEDSIILYFLYLILSFLFSIFLILEVW